MIYPFNTPLIKSLYNLKIHVKIHKHRKRQNDLVISNFREEKKYFSYRDMNQH